MYNMLFGQNPLSSLLLGMIGLTKSDFARFRDVFISNGEIAIYTRLGGGNRECYCGDENNHECYQQTIRQLQSHQNYIRDEDDDFDCTYATFYFKIPDQYKEFVGILESGKFKPDERWANKFEEIKNSNLEQMEQKYPELVRLTKEIAEKLNSSPPSTITRGGE
jgi:hypothetical protein